MPNYERGSFEPDDVRVFDGGADDDDAEGSHLPMVIVISLLVLAAFGGVVWLAYNNGVAKGRADVPPRIVAQNTDTQAAAPDSGEAAPAKAIKVYQQPAGAEDETNPEAAINKTTAPAATSTVRTAPAEAKPVVVQAQPKPAAIVAEETKKPVAPPPVAATPTTPAKAIPKPAAPPATAPAVATAPPTALTTPAKAAVVAPPSSPPPAKTTATSAPAAASGAFVLQIGAYKSEADASAAWKAYQAKHATLLSGVSSSIQKADLGDKGVWYRLRAGSFADKDTAAALCDRLKADGGACFPAK